MKVSSSRTQASLAAVRRMGLAARFVDRLFAGRRYMEVTRGGDASLAQAYGSGRLNR